jgi:hypothetical protein
LRRTRDEAPVGSKLDGVQVAMQRDFCETDLSR